MLLHQLKIDADLHSKIIPETETGLKKYLKEHLHHFPRFLGFSSAVIALRICQKIMIHVQKSLYANQFKTFKFAGCYPGSWNLKLPIKFILILILKNISQFFMISLKILFFKSRIVIDHTPVTIMDGFGNKIFNDSGPFDGLNYFLKHGPIKILNQCENLVYGTEQLISAEQKKIFKIKGVQFSNDIYFDICLAQNKGFSFRLKVLTDHFKIGLKSFYYALLHPEALLILSDFNLLALVLNSKIEHIIWCQSLSSTQYLWMLTKQRDFKTHMVWFSTNSKGMKFKKDREVNFFPNTWFNDCDIHYVWTEGDEKWLRRCFKNTDINPKILVVGPIIYDVKPVFNVQPKKYKICIFDVLPNNSFGEIIGPLNYYTYETVEKFFVDILNIVNEINLEKNIKIELCLKNKKFPQIKSNLSVRYLDLLKRLEKYESFYYLNPDSNVYDIILSSAITICIPYTSPGVLAKVLNRPSFFYDSLEMIYPCDYSGNEIILINSKNFLKQKISEVFNEY
jgi:polysaccharide biosynthesis PFTS motif protein